MCAQYVTEPEWSFVKTAIGNGLHRSLPGCPQGPPELQTPTAAPSALRPGREGSIQAERFHFSCGLDCSRNRSTRFNWTNASKPKSKAHTWCV